MFDVFDPGGLEIEIIPLKIRCGFSSSFLLFSRSKIWRMKSIRINQPSQAQKEQQLSKSSPIADKRSRRTKPATMKDNGGDRQLKRAASCEKNDADAESFYPLFNPKSKKMKETMENVVKESAEMRKNGSTLVADNQKCSCTECNSTFEFNFSAPNNSKNGPFACVKCNDKFCGSSLCDSSEFSCDFCTGGLCRKCRDYDEKMLRCDGCGVTSCNSLFDGCKSCPTFVPDEYYDGLPICQECRTW